MDDDLSMTSLLRRIDAICRDAFGAAGYDPASGEVRLSDRPDLADFQCSGLLRVAKQHKLNPQIAADAVMGHLADNDLFSVEFARPGFLNFTVSDASLIAQVARALDDPEAFLRRNDDPQRFLLDYGGPNLAKEMHVGHLRSCIVGQALKTVLSFAGHHTISDVHLGDWGLQMGQLISQIADERPQLLQGEGTLAMADLQEWYPRASARSKDDTAFRERARSATAMLQAGKPEYVALWQKVVETSNACLQRDYGRLGVSFDQWYGESRYQAALDGLVARLVEEGKAEPSDGAIVVHLPEAEKLPPLILRNSNGGYGYGATDLATIEDRIEQDHPDIILYVVDARQKMHFRQVFGAADQCGILGDTRAEHIPFGTVNGTDGKPFKTRAGGVMRLHDLLETMNRAARDRLEAAGSVPTEDHAAVAEDIAVAAIKFGELSHDRESNYVFDIDQFLQFEGKTGPYIQYSCVRVRTLLENAAKDGLQPGAPTTMGTGGRELVLCLDEFAAQLNRTIEARKPSFLANHVYKLANRTNSFYQANRVLSEGVAPAAAASHLALLRVAMQQIELCLRLLGINVPKAM
ncbi:arginine--tRNA ligase [uncultured Roseobacter sp.]|uniref:arginine--tRNA ligase n=1 Tax=uncultured Roseobacter sp. TaxID=114847 RepID=UPI00261396AB|nr:arginine--tRNA ligase [uncultured Roseobacter sp.]